MKPLAVTAHLAPSVRRRSRQPIVAVNAQASGIGDPDEAIFAITSAMRDEGVPARGRVLRSEDALRVTLEDGRRVVLAGGDGTLHAAVNAGVALPELALVPAGRANNVARALGIPADTAGAARLAATGITRPVDLLRVEAGARVVHAVEAVSGGFQAQVRGGYDGADSADLSAGARALAAGLRRYRPFRIRLTLDGRPAFDGEAAQLFLSNLPFFGFGFRVDPVARASDGRLEAIVAEAGSRLALTRLLASAYRGRHLERDGVMLRRARRAEVEGPLPLVCDSEVLGSESAEVSVVPGGMRIVS